MVGTILKFILYSLKPLSRTADIWDIKDVIQAILLTLGWAGGGSALLNISPGIATGILAGMPALLFLIAGVKLRLKLDKHEQKPRPNLEIYGLPYTDKRKITIDGKQLIGEPFFCHVKFSNNPNILSPEANAKKVYATLTFYDIGGKEKCKLDKVRQGDIAEPPKQQISELPHKYYEVEYSANGHALEITIALKYEEDENCYAFDDYCYNYSSTKWRKPEYLLKGDSFYVTVDLSGENTKGIGWFKLKNHGIGKGIEAEIISQPNFDKVDLPT